MSARPHVRLLLAFAVLIGAFALARFDGLLFGLVAAERDTAHFYYPLDVWASAELKAGRLPLWLPHIFSGYPIFADGEAGLAYPPKVLALLLLPVDAAFVLMRLFHLAVAGVGCFLLARQWGLTIGAGVVAGLIFGLGSFMQAQVHHENIIRTAAWLPVTLAAVEAALRASGWVRLRYALLASLTVGLASLGLHVQILAISLLSVAAYGLCRWCVGPIAGANGWLQRGLAVAWIFPLAALLGVSMGAIQLLPLAELGQFSERGAGLPYAEAAAYSLTRLGLVQLLFPFVFRLANYQQWGLWIHWESYLYVGLGGFWLAVLALVCVRRRVVWMWAALALVAILLSLGQYSPLNLHYLVWQLPGMDGLRAPGRFTLSATLALAMLAAFGFDWLQRRALDRPAQPDQRAGRKLAYAAIGLPIALFLLLSGLHQLWRAYPEATRAFLEATYLAVPRDSYRLTSNMAYEGLLWWTNVLSNRWTAAALFGTGGFLCLLAVWQFGHRRWARQVLGWRVAVIAMLAADLLVFGWTIHPRESLAALHVSHPAVTAVQSSLSRDDADEGPYRVMAAPTINPVAPNRLIQANLHEVSGYSSLVSPWHRTLFNRVFTTDDELLDLWNVRYIIESTRGAEPREYRDVRFHPTGHLLHGPADSPLGQERFWLPEGINVGEVRIVSALVNGQAIPQGEPVAVVRLLGPDAARLWERTLHAGQDTAEWAARAPDSAGRIAHAAVETAFELRPVGSSRPQDTRTLSFASLPVERATPARMLEVEVIAHGAQMIVWGITAVGEDGRPHYLDSWQKTKYRLIYREREIMVMENTAAFPRAYVVQRGRPVWEAEWVLDHMERLSFRPREEVILHGDAPMEPEGQVAWRDPGDGSFFGQARFERTDPRWVALRVSAPEDAFLVLTDLHYPGWHAYVNGQEVPMYRGNLLFRAVQVPPGEHLVEFRFGPESIRQGALVSAAAVSLALALLAVTFVVPGRRRA